MTGIMDVIGQHLSSLEATELLWEAALLASACAALFLWSVHARRNRKRLARDEEWRARSHLRSRGA